MLHHHCKYNFCYPSGKVKFRAPSVRTWLHTCEGVVVPPNVGKKTTECEFNAVL